MMAVSLAMLVVLYAVLRVSKAGLIVRAALTHASAVEALGHNVPRVFNFAPLVFPERIDAGLRVVRLGTSSVRYEVGLFSEGNAEPAAQGHFVHVYVDRATRRPVTLPADLRAALAPLVVADQAD